MLIDWFTVFAQLINFLILLFLLNRVLYKPIVKTIRNRQEEIESNWQRARQEKQIATEQIVLYQEKQQLLEQQREGMIAQAQQEAEQEYQKLIQQAKQDVKQQQLTWEKAIAQQQQTYFQELEQKLIEQVYGLTEQAFQELANSSLEQQIIQAFIERLQNLTESERQSLAQSLGESEHGLGISSSFELSPTVRHQLIDCLHQKQIYQADQIRFTQVPELICGIELQAKSYKIAWNLHNYLSSLRQQKLK